VLSLVSECTKICKKISQSIYCLGTVVSIAFFNFAGVSVTKELSATTRMVLDSVRTLVIWAVTLALGWQSFHYLQVSEKSHLKSLSCECNIFNLLRMLDSPFLKLRRK